MTRKFQNTDAALSTLAGEIMLYKNEVGSRLGERTMEVLHEQTVLEKPWQREILTPERHANIVAQIAETMWVLAGRNDVEFLGHYLPRAKDFSDDGVAWRGGYGPRLRSWGDQDTSDAPYIDQVAHIVDLLSRDRTSRRAVISIYNPSVDTFPGKDIPCNDFLSFISRRGFLDMSVFVRSNDLIWGWSGINAFEWSALQEIVAGLLGIKVGYLVFNTTSLHVYDRHWNKADNIAGRAVVEQWKDSPRFAPQDLSVEYLDTLIGRWFRLEKALRTGATDVRRGVYEFPEPMMQSWLRVIAWYWTGDREYLFPLEGTRLAVAVNEAPKSVREQALGRAVKAGPNPADKFVEFADSLHREKSAAYGDSWKRRGEQMSILANIARKVDRLQGGAETSDETKADTAVDLLIYVVKYRLWLSETNSTLRLPFARTQDEDTDVLLLLNFLAAGTPENLQKFGVGDISDLFTAVEQEVLEDPNRGYDTGRLDAVRPLLFAAFSAALSLWEATDHDA